MVKIPEACLDPISVLASIGKLFKFKIVPTNYTDSAGNTNWQASHVNGGGTVYSAVIFCNTSVTANSRGLLFHYANGLNSGDRGQNQCDYSKKLEWNFTVNRDYSDAQVIARMQLKQVNTEGDLANVGLGLRIDNFVLTGEAYGTARQAINLGVSLTTNYRVRVKIIHIPGVRVEFWVNGVLRGTLTGTAVPFGVLADTYWVESIINGATGAVNAYIGVGDMLIIQEH